MIKPEKIVYAVVILFLVWGCNPSSRKGGKISAKKLDSLKSHFELLNSDVALNWSVMIEDDDEKLFSMKRLLEEVSYTGAFNEKQFNQLMAELETVKESRYDQETMKNSDLIDDYDSMSNRIITEVIDFAQHHPEYDGYPLMGELINEIMEAQYNVLHHRIRYDRSVDNYNEFVMQNDPIMNQITNQNVDQLPVFRID